jgi:hypothetical protein
LRNKFVLTLIKELFDATVACLQTAPPSGQQQDTPYSAISCENCRQCIRLPPLGSPSKKNKQHPQQQQQQQEVPNTMYTNAANLQRTIWLQQVNVS